MIFVLLMILVVSLAGCHPGTGPAPDKNTFTSVCTDTQCNPPS